jgi:hypothetical protein
MIFHGFLAQLAVKGLLKNVGLKYTQNTKQYYVVLVDDSH